jgi:xylulokinase
VGDILAVDVGTTVFKMGVYDTKLSLKAEASRNYVINIHDKVQVDIEPHKWWNAFCETSIELNKYLPSVDVIAFSVTTPGLVAMDDNGFPLCPAILFLDGRSHQQAREIRQLVGEDTFLRETCNLPASGGSSLCSILWIKSNLPNVWLSTKKFGHCNTFMVKQLTGRWAIDPSTTSITGMYNTTLNNLTWNTKILKVAGIPIRKLPPLYPSHYNVGYILPEVASRLGYYPKVKILVGGNDAVLAALSGGLINPGDVNFVHGTCDITSVCVDHPISSPKFNIRCHIVPNRWLTFHVLNTGGKALEWFHSVFCRDMSKEYFFENYLPSILVNFLNDEHNDLIEKELPIYIPYLQGSRYDTETLTASYSQLTLATTRDMMLLALLKGNLTHPVQYLNEVSQFIKLNNRAQTTGGVARIKGFLDAKKRWTGNFDYEFQDQSSLRGAAILGQWHLRGTSTP